VDIIVTTPKSRMKEAAQEAEDCKRAGGGHYFRRFSRNRAVDVSDRIYYVEDGYVRGFGLVDKVREHEALTCDTTGREWPAGWYAFMDAMSWKWIAPIRMKGFQGYRLAGGYPRSGQGVTHRGDERPVVKIVGGWLDPKPGLNGKALKSTSMGDGICAKCKKRVGTTVSIAFEGKRTPQLCPSCYSKACKNAGKPVKEKTMTKKGANVKEREVVDRDSGEVLNDAACLERLRAILAKENEIEDAEKKAADLSVEVDEAKDAFDEAKERLADARGGVAALEAELRDLVRGQKLLF